MRSVESKTPSTVRHGVLYFCRVRPIAWVLLAMALFAVALSHATAQQLEENVPEQLDEVGVVEQLDPPAQIPLDLEFVDTDGNTITLAEIFDGTLPVILTLNYSDCPMLCSLQLNGLLTGMKDMPWTLGKEYRIVTISINPLETPQRARLTKQKYLKLYGRAGSAAGWRFLTCRDESHVKQVARTVGFGYQYDPDTKQYAHVAALMICSPNGQLSRYLYGIEYDPQTLKFALLEASQGKVGTTADQMLLYCFHYDATRGRYGPHAFRLMQFGGVLTVLIFGGALSAYWIRERRKTGAADEGDSQDAESDASAAAPEKEGGEP